MADLTTREEELQIEIERLKAWLWKIQHEAYKGVESWKIEWMADRALRRSSCASLPDWSGADEWAKVGDWPPKRLEIPDD